MSLRLAVVLSIIVTVAVVAVATYYAKQLPTTTVADTRLQENTMTPTMSTTSAEASTSKQGVFLAEIGDWSIVITLYSNGTGLLRVEYVGVKPLTVKNPLLPLTAGLNIALEYYDSSKNTVLKSLGTYYYNTTVIIEHGNYSQMKFDSRNLKSIRIEGRILGQIPVRVYIPLTTTTCEKTGTVTVTVTKIAGSPTTTPRPACELELKGEYPELHSSPLRKEVRVNQTVYTDNIIEIHIPLKTYSTRIPLTIINKASTPLVLNKWYLEYEIINISFDGEHYVKVNKKIAYAIPTTTTPPWIMDCTRVDSSIRVLGASDILMPNQTTTLALDIPDDILKDHNEAWIYVRMSLEYWGVKQLFQILLNKTVWKYSWAAKMYGKTSELNIVFDVHIVKE